MLGHQGPKFMEEEPVSLLDKLHGKDVCVSLLLDPQYRHLEPSSSTTVPSNLPDRAQLKSTVMVFIVSRSPVRRPVRLSKTPGSNAIHPCDSPLGTTTLKTPCLVMYSNGRRILHPTTLFFESSRRSDSRLLQLSGEDRRSHRLSRVCGLSARSWSL